MSMEAIYLHFIDRELYREARISKHYLDEILCNALKVTYLLSYESLEASIAFIWELYYDAPKTRNMLIKLLDFHLLHLVSSFYSVDEVIAFYQKIYRHEAKRYRMYFRQIPHKLEQYQPEVMKSESTTDKLEYDLKQWLITEKLELFSQKQDEILLREGGQGIKKALERRDDRAITLSLFNNIDLSVYNRNQLGRNLSLLHASIYMKHVCGDIVTGISGLQFYDRLSKCFPLNDYCINYCIIVVCDKRVLLDSNVDVLLAKEMESIHDKIMFVEEKRKMIWALYCCLSKKMEHQNIRNMICNSIKKAAIKMPNLSGNIGWDYLLVRLIALDNCLKKENPKYYIYRLEEEKVVKTMLICTATDKETDVVLQKVKEYNLDLSVEKYEGMYLYRLGIMGKLNLLLTQTEMGTERMGSARDKIRDLARILNPDYIISTGICYGLKRKSAKVKDGNSVGDIVIANQLQMYETAKVSEVNGEIQYIPRGDKVAVSTELLDAFRTASHLYTNKNHCLVSFGLLLTGNLLVNSQQVVDDLKKRFPEALNGDMEAGGIYSACHDNGIKWIAVKAISDWGYDKTDKHQDLARQNLYDFLFDVLENGLIN